MIYDKSFLSKFYFDGWDFLAEFVRLRPPARTFGIESLCLIFNPISSVDDSLDELYPEENDEREIDEREFFPKKVKQN